MSAIPGENCDAKRRCLADEKDAFIARLRAAAELGGVVRDIMEVAAFDGVPDDTVIPIYPEGVCEDANKLTVGNVRKLAQLLGTEPSVSENGNDADQSDTTKTI